MINAESPNPKIIWFAWTILYFAKICVAEKDSRFQVFKVLCLFRLGKYIVIAKSIKHIDFEKFKPDNLEGYKWNKSLSDILINDSLAKAAYLRINKSGVKIILEGTKFDDYTFGLTEFIARGTKLQVRIFLPITKSPAVTARVIIHESRHVKTRLLGRYNSKQEEYIAHFLEFLYTHERRPNYNERQIIKKIIDSIEDYNDLPKK